MTEINKKYELIKLTEEDLKIKSIKDLTEAGKTLYRIKALRDFSNVKKGDIGGFVEKEDNLSHEGNCWIYDVSMVYDDGYICDDAVIGGNTVINKYCLVCLNSKLYDNVVIGVDDKINAFNILCNEEKVKHYNKKNEGKPNINKVYPNFIKEIAKAMDYGDNKYNYKNWQDYKDINELMSALGRHYLSCCYGEIIDKETMLNHLAQVGSNAMMIMYLLDHNIIKVEDLYYFKNINIDNNTNK